MRTMPPVVSMVGDWLWLALAWLWLALAGFGAGGWLWVWLLAVGWQRAISTALMWVGQDRMPRV